MLNYIKQLIKKNLKSLLILIPIGIIVLISTYYEYTLIIKTPIDATDTAKVSFLIKKGDSPKKIGDNLKEKGLISSPNSFYAYIKLNSLDKSIIAGRFYLQKSMNIIDIGKAITDPKNAEIIVTIQEGLRIEDIDKKLTDLEVIQKGDFMAAAKAFDGWKYYSFLDQKTLSTLKYPIEGYLYPDTYFLNPVDFKPNRLIYAALDNFEKKTLDIIPLIKKHSVNEIITMASIIENEIYGEENRSLVSGILWKRIENNWFLGADATILYVTEDRKITSADLELDSPYNTRKSKSLPPGPVCNPSIESIKAAMFPKESPYWYYLTDKNGKAIFSKTNEEHNANRAKHL